MTSAKSETTIDESDHMDKVINAMNKYPALVKQLLDVCENYQESVIKKIVGTMRQYPNLIDMFLEICEVIDNDGRVQTIGPDSNTITLRYEKKADAKM